MGLFNSETVDTRTKQIDLSTFKGEETMLLVSIVVKIKGCAFKHHIISVEIHHYSINRLHNVLILIF